MDQNKAPTSWNLPCFFHLNFRRCAGKITACYPHVIWGVFLTSLNPAKRGDFLWNIKHITSFQGTVDAKIKSRSAPWRSFSWAANKSYGMREVNDKYSHHLWEDHEFRPCEAMLGFWFPSLDCFKTGRIGRYGASESKVSILSVSVIKYLKHLPNMSGQVRTSSSIIILILIIIQTNASFSQYHQHVSKRCLETIHRVHLRHTMVVSRHVEACQGMCQME